MLIEPDYLREPLLASGRKRLLGFILLTAGLEALVKTAAFVTGTLKTPQLVGTALTVVLLFFLWKGSHTAWWLAVLFLTLAIGFGLYVIVSTRAWVGALLLGFVVFQTWLLTSKAVRAFMANQRETAFR